MTQFCHSSWSESFVWLAFLQRQRLDFWNRVFPLFSLLLWLTSIHPRQHISRKLPPQPKPPCSQCSAHWLVKNHNCSRGTMELSASSMWPGGLLWLVGVRRLSDVDIALLRGPAARGGEDASLGGGAFGDTLPLPDTTPSLTGPMTSLWWRPSPHVLQRRLWWFHWCDAIRLMNVKIEVCHWLMWCRVF